MASGNSGRQRVEQTRQWEKFEALIRTIVHRLSDLESDAFLACHLGTVLQ